MKKILLPILLFIAVTLHAAGPYGVSVNTNGVLLSPTNFFNLNTNLWWPYLPPSSGGGSGDTTNDLANGTNAVKAWVTNQYYIQDIICPSNDIAVTLVTNDTGVTATLSLIPPTFQVNTYNGSMDIASTDAGALDMVGGILVTLPAPTDCRPGKTIPIKNISSFDDELYGADIGGWGNLPAGGGVIVVTDGVSGWWVVGKY